MLNIFVLSALQEKTSSNRSFRPIINLHRFYFHYSKQQFQHLYFRINRWYDEINKTEYKTVNKANMLFLFIEVVRPLIHFVFPFITKMCTSKMPMTQFWDLRRTLKDFGVTSTFPACFYSKQTKKSCCLRFGMLSSIFHFSN